MNFPVIAFEWPFTSLGVRLALVTEPVSRGHTYWSQTVHRYPPTVRSIRRDLS